MKTLLRSSLLALLAISAFAGITANSTAKFGLGPGIPTNCNCGTKPTSALK